MAKKKKIVKKKPVKKAKKIAKKKVSTKKKTNVTKKKKVAAKKQREAAAAGARHGNGPAQTEETTGTSRTRKQGSTRRLRYFAPFLIL